MLFPIPAISSYSMVYVAVWALEQTTTTTTTDSSDVCSDGQSPEAAPTESVEQRWVFKGYEWRPAAVVYPYVDNKCWDAAIDSNSDTDVREREIRLQQERHAREAKAAQMEAIDSRLDAAAADEAKRAEG